MKIEKYRRPYAVTSNRSTSVQLLGDTAAFERFCQENDIAKATVVRLLLGALLKRPDLAKSLIAAERDT